ncbi:MAG: hypothetical protein LBT41_01115 [Candidatus Methanoplasma sp.]|jgi:hypothetical protein|nr:hypothetical protein [Candidatus Methanoplasma sp.]
MRLTKTEKKIAFAAILVIAVLALIALLAEDGVRIALWIGAALIAVLDVFMNYWLLKRLSSQGNPGYANKIVIPLVAQSGSRMKQFLVDSYGEFVGRTDGKNVGSISVAPGTHELTVRYGKNEPVVARLSAEDGVSIILNLDDLGNTVVQVVEPEVLLTDEDRAAAKKRLRKVKIYAVVMVNVMFILAFVRIVLIANDL